MNQGLKKIVLYARIIMPMLFIGIGLFCIFLPAKVNLDPQRGYLFGGLVIVYGLFRGYRAISDLRQES